MTERFIINRCKDKAYPCPYHKSVLEFIFIGFYFQKKNKKKKLAVLEVDDDRIKRIKV